MPPLVWMTGLSASGALIEMIGNTMSGATEEQRDALARLVAAGGELDRSKLYRLIDVAGAHWRLFGTPVQGLFDRGLVYITGSGHAITITSLGRALAREKP